MTQNLKTPNPAPLRAAERARQVSQEAQMDALMRSLKRWFLIALGMPLLGFAVYKWEQHRNAQVVSRSSIGTLQDLRSVHSPRGIKPVVLVLKTSTGFVALYDPLNLPVGAPLVQERRASGRTYVCDALRTQCAQVVQAATPGQGAAAGAT
jgi:hypothetical protein